mgnify:CR=1 FL=1
MAPADISQWLLSDDGAAPKKYRIPPGTIIPARGFRSFTSAQFNASPASVFSFNLDRTLLRPGANLFAVEIHNDAANSSDIWFQMSLVGQPVIIHNLSPVVEVTTPTNGTHFLAPSQIALAATASDGDGSVAKVEFFASGTADASGYGEGQRSIGYANVATDASGQATVSVLDRPDGRQLGMRVLYVK